MTFLECSEEVVDITGDDEGQLGENMIDHPYSQCKLWGKIFYKNSHSLSSAVEADHISWQASTEYTLKILV